MPFVNQIFGQAKTSKCFHTPRKKEEIIAKMVA